MEHSKESSKGHEQGRENQSHKGTDKNENKGSKSKGDNKDKGNSKR